MIKNLIAKAEERLGDDLSSSRSLDYDYPSRNALFIIDNKLMVLDSNDELDEDDSVIITKYKYFENGEMKFITKTYALNARASRTYNITKNATLQIQPDTLREMMIFLESMGCEIEKITLEERYHFYKIKKGKDEFLIWDDWSALSAIMNRSFTSEFDISKLMELERFWCRKYTSIEL